MSPSSRRDFLRTPIEVATVTLAGCISQPRVSDPKQPDGEASQLTGYNPDISGPGSAEPQLAWRYDAGTPTTNTSPVVGDGLVFVPGSGDPGLIRAVDIESGERRWEFEPAGYASSAPALVDDTLYVGTWGKQFYAIDIATGETRWRQEIGHRFGSSSPVVADGTVYVGCRNGISAVTTAGENAWRVSFESTREDPPYVKSSPAVADGHVFIRASDGRLRAIRSATTA